MKKVLLLYGGMSTEHDVSLSSAKSILDNYDTNLFEITPVYIDKNNNWCLNNSKIDNIISFLKEFDIFPSLIAYNYINNIFHSLSLMCDYIYGVDVIDKERFVLFIFLLSNEIQFEEDLSIKDKVLFLVDRMAMSEGIERMIKKGNVKFNKGAKKINDNLKKEYPERYKGKEVKKNTFVNIFS